MVICTCFQNELTSPLGDISCSRACHLGNSMILVTIDMFLPHFSCCLDFCVSLLGGFSAHGFFDGFLFPVKELGLLTNPGHWVRVLDVVGSYMYIVL
jgi:hypothetical protein